MLTCGACANLYSGGIYQSSDADFVLAGHCSTNDVDRALATLGFAREGGRYVHRLVSFFVEFSSRALGIGRDLKIRPVWRSHRAAKTLALSPTDPCRDRLAAFHFWNDLQSLGAAVAIAMRNRVAFAKVRAWSRGEGHPEGYTVFLAELRRTRVARRPRKKQVRPSPKR